MARNKPACDNRRNGEVRKRTQLQTLVMGEKRFTNRDKARPVYGSKGRWQEVQGGWQGAASI